MFPESLEYPPGAFVMEGYVPFGVDSHIIHVNLQPLFWEHICKNMVHEGLEGGGSIAKSEEHDSGFKESHQSDKGSFPLIFLPDTNVVISPTNVKFSEQGRFLHIINEFRDEREGVGVSDGVGV